MRMCVWYGCWYINLFQVSVREIERECVCVCVPIHLLVWRQLDESVYEEVQPGYSGQDMYACLCMYIYIYIYIYTWCTDLCASVCVHVMCVCMCTYTPMHMWVIRTCSFYRAFTAQLLSVFTHSIAHAFNRARTPSILTTQACTSACTDTNILHECMLVLCSIHTHIHMTYTYVPFQSCHNFQLASSRYVHQSNHIHTNTQTYTHWHSCFAAENCISNPFPELPAGFLCTSTRFGAYLVSMSVCMYVWKYTCMYLTFIRFGAYLVSMSVCMYVSIHVCILRLLGSGPTWWVCLCVCM
jgi:hypothetical protein